MYTFFKNKHWAMWAYLGGFCIILLLISQTYCSVLLNDWYRHFYDILQNVEKNTLADFWDSLFKFMLIALPYVLIISVTNFLSRIYMLRWRQAIAEDMSGKWLSTNSMIEGASQRIQEDTARFAQILGSLGIEIIRGVMVLIAFIPILWTLSSTLIVPLFGKAAGSLVWYAIIISFGGIIVSWFVGIKLPILEYNNRKTEAAYRKQLVFGEDNRQLITNESLFSLFTGLRLNHQTLYLHQSYFDLWASFYSQFVVIIPYIIGGVGLFDGTLTLGMLVQISNCFGKVHESFSIVLNRWTAITELRSIYIRLKEFYNILEEGK